MAPKTFTNWKDCCKYLFELIGKNKVLAGSNTIIEDTGSGIRVHSQAGGSGAGSAEYKSYFKVIPYDTDAGTVMVVNGADEEATVCGSFTAGSSNISCTATELTVSGAGVVYIRIYKSGSTYRYEFAFAATLPSVVREIYKPLASTNADGVPAQVWTGGAITDINGSYVA
jgi:hypothetical protein